MRGVGFSLVLLAMTGAGIASAHVFVPMPEDPANTRRSAKAPVVAPVAAVVVPPSQSYAEGSAPPAPVSSPRKQVVETSSSKPALEANRPPVPLMMKPRPAVEQPISPPSTQVAVAAPDLKAAGEPKANLGEKSAKAAVEADGYKGVRLLNKDANGNWQARAMRGSTEVSLTVDKRGGVRLD